MDLASLKALWNRSKVRILAVLAVIGPVAGFFWNDFTNFRSKRLEAEDAAITQLISANDDVKAPLVKFSHVALGDGTVSTDDKSSFDIVLNKARDKASNLEAKIPSLSLEYDNYVDALIELKRSVDELKGATTGKSFVHAVDLYINASDELKSKAEKRRSSYLDSFVSN